MEECLYFGVIIFSLFSVFVDMPQSSPYAGAVVLVLVWFSKINRTARVFVSFPKNEAINDKSIYPSGEALPSVVSEKNQC